MANIACLDINTNGQYVLLEDLIKKENPTFAFVDGITYTIQSQGSHHCVLCESIEKPLRGGFLLSSKPIKYVCDTTEPLYVKTFNSCCTINVAE